MRGVNDEPTKLFPGFDAQLGNVARSDDPGPTLATVPGSNSVPQEQLALMGRLFLEKGQAGAGIQSAYRRVYYV